MNFQKTSILAIPYCQILELHLDLCSILNDTAPTFVHVRDVPTDEPLRFSFESLDSHLEISV